LIDIKNIFLSTKNEALFPQPAFPYYFFQFGNKAFKTKKFLEELFYSLNEHFLSVFVEF